MSMPKILKDLRDVKDESITATSAILSNGAIVLSLPVEVCTGSLVKFNAPCDCSSVTAGVQIGDKTYSLVNARGSSIASGSAFRSGSLISIILDTANAKAYVQNTNTLVVDSDNVLSLI